MRKVTIIATLVFLVIMLPMVFTYLTFSNSIDCDQLVIDTYELHSNIDIPDVEYVNCYFDEKLNTRISVYNLKGNFDLEQFELVHVPKEDFLVGTNLLSEDEQPNESSIYLVSGEKYGTKWTYAIDRESKRLWAELNYNYL